MLRAALARPSDSVNVALNLPRKISSEIGLID